MNTYSMGAAPEAAGSDHLGDDELLRLIDNDSDDAWRAERDRHLASCDECALQLEALAADAGLFRFQLEQAAFEDASHDDADVVPIARAPSARRASAWHAPVWARAAAVLLMLAAPVAALPALRAWIAETVSGPAAPAVEVRTMSAPADAADHVALIRFIPAAGAFAVVVDAAQADGVLRVVQDAAAAEAVFQALPVAGQLPAEPVVAESTLRLRNETGAMASYSLVVPAGVTRVSVSIAGAQVADIVGTALRNGADVSLRPR